MDDVSIEDFEYAGRASASQVPARIRHTPGHSDSSNPDSYVNAAAFSGCGVSTPNPRCSRSLAAIAGSRLRGTSGG